MQRELSFWSESVDDLFAELDTTRAGLSTETARQRLEAYGYNRFQRKERLSVVRLFARQFKSAIVLLLLFAAVLSFLLGERTETWIIFAIVLLSGLLGFWQEYNATNAVEELLSLVEVEAEVVRDGEPSAVKIDDVVPGDITRLNAGDTIPGDCRLLEAESLHVNEAVLTGETFPVEKTPGTVSPTAPIADRTNSLFMGTHVVSGEATAVVVRTGERTELGQISERLQYRPPETDFERGIRHFGHLLLEVTLLLVLAIFAINVYFQRPIFDSFLFALALAVGLTPQLLPAIITINLASGARDMATENVIVKQPSAIENFGSMDVFCADKTGTLTEGTIRVHSAIDIDGNESERTFLHAYLNSSYESGFENPIDEAVREADDIDTTPYRKLGEVPYDFTRKRLSVLLADRDESRLITKGAVENVLDVCTTAETASGDAVPISEAEPSIRDEFEAASEDGFRVLGVATRTWEEKRQVTRADEAGVTFLGLLLLEDPPKDGIAETVRDLESLGVGLKIISGDNRYVVHHVGELVGLADERQVLTGTDIAGMSDDALRARIDRVNLFAEVEPSQKERIIVALQDQGHVVGYLGDGINDAPSLRAADAGISVDSAVDVAKEAANIVLLERNLSVLVDGIRSGRRTFMNTLKYIFLTTSANFGNMFSMAGASLFLPFLPLLPVQILLINLLSDLPAITISTDTVDSEWVDTPRRWNISFIRDFMVTFGTVSSVFDFFTFGVLLIGLRATVTEFRTGWFVFSVLTEVLMVLLIRTRKPIFESRPSGPLVVASLAIALLTPLFPMLFIGRVFDFTPLTIPLFVALLGLLVGYLLTIEVVKRVFYRHISL